MTLMELSRAVYPGECGFKSNTGGIYAYYKGKTLRQIAICHISHFYMNRCIEKFEGKHQQ